LMFWHPGVAALTIIWVLATYAVVFGIIMIALAFRLRGHSSAGGAVAAV
jgi:uncharacterized membrane protein HdeD (DUF308 family)